MYIAGTDTKLVFLSCVGRENSQHQPIHLLVQNQKDENSCYLLDRSVPLRALTAHYCARRGLPDHAFQFIYDGAEVPGAKSAEDIGMDYWDVIDTGADVPGG